MVFVGVVMSYVTASVVGVGIDVFTEILMGFFLTTKIECNNCECCTCMAWSYVPLTYSRKECVTELKQLVALSDILPESLGHAGPNSRQFPLTLYRFALIGVCFCSLPSPGEWCSDRLGEGTPDSLKHKRKKDFLSTDMISDAF